MVLGDKTVGKSALTQMFHSNGTPRLRLATLPRLLRFAIWSVARTFAFEFPSAQHYPKNYVMVRLVRCLHSSELR